MDYKEEAEKIFRELFFEEEWMDESDWSEFVRLTFKEEGINYDILGEQLKEGVDNGTPIEEQKDILKKVFTQ